MEERSKEHEVESGNTKGRTTGMNRRRAKDKDITGSEDKRSEKDQDKK